MNRRFPDYRPSTALRQAIEALRKAQTDRAAGAVQPDPPGGPDAPGHEGADVGEGLGDKSDTDAFVSGSDKAVGLGQSSKDGND